MQQQVSDGRLGALDANNNKGQLRTTKTKYDMVNVGSGCCHAIKDDWVMLEDRVEHGFGQTRGVRGTGGAGAGMVS